MSIAKRHPAQQHRHQNRLRNDFELTEQRHMIPLLIIAAVIAALVHVMAFRATPWLLRMWRSTIHAPLTERVAGDDVRVVVRDIPAELQQSQEIPPPDPEELEQLESMPHEIDIMDANVEILVMAPVETNIPLQAPERTEGPETQQTMPMPESSALMPPAAELDEDVEHLVPEPTPLNTNSVIVNASAQFDQVDEAEGFMERELRRQAEQGQSGLPSDTRSLSELMGISNPGSSSGVARLGADFLFAFNESKLKNSARISLLQLAALIHKNPSTTFIIEGHTDGIGGDAYNEQLSMRRAAAVVAWLSGNGIPIDRVFMRACGSTRPLVSTDLPREQQALNRRVEIHMRRPGEVMPEGCVPAKK